jgi:hypothetical protein
LKPRFDKRQLAPGKQGKVLLDVNTLGQPAGPHTWQLTVLYRQGDRIHEQALQIMATVATEVSVQPAAMTLLTQGAISRDVLVTDLRSQPLTIVGVEVTSSLLRAAAGPFQRDDFGNLTSKIRIETAAQLPAGRHEERLVIHTDDPVYRELVVPITIVSEQSSR